jgi:CBS domain containing-hemolysin-like protein
MIVSTVLAFILLTLTQILFGELMPKALSITSPLKSALFVTRPLKIFYTVFQPFIWTLNQAFRVVSAVL